MNTYRKEFNETKIATYEDVRKIIDDVEKSATSFDIRQKRYHFNFSCGGSHCTVESIDAFIEESYGREDFCLISMQMMYFLTDNQYYCVNYLCGISVSATSNTLLEKVVNQLGFNTLPSTRQHTITPQTLTNSQPSVESNTIPVHTTLVQGNGNYIITGNGTITHNEEKREPTKASKKNNFFSNHPILVGVLSAVLAGVILMFGFWKDLVCLIEQLFR